MSLVLILLYPTTSIAQMDRQYQQEQYNKQSRKKFCNYAWDNAQFIMVYPDDNGEYSASQEHGMRYFIDKKSQVWKISVEVNYCSYEGILNKESPSSEVETCYQMYKTEGMLLYRYVGCGEYRREVKNIVKEYAAYSRKGLVLRNDGKLYVIR